MTDLQNSILCRTGQLWKYVTMLILGWIGMILGALSLLSYFLVREWAFPLAICAGIIFIVEILVALSMKCPKCNVRWYWKALNRPVGEDSIIKIRMHTSCPICGFTK